jgi:hypothetical protein
MIFVLVITRWVCFGHSGRDCNRLFGESGSGKRAVRATARAFAIDDFARRGPRGAVKNNRMQSALVMLSFEFKCLADEPLDEPSSTWNGGRRTAGKSISES